MNLTKIGTSSAGETFARPIDIPMHQRVSISTMQ